MWMAVGKPMKEILGKTDSGYREWLEGKAGQIASYGKFAFRELATLGDWPGIKAAAVRTECPAVNAEYAADILIENKQEKLAVQVAIETPYRQVTWHVADTLTKKGLGRPHVVDITRGIEDDKFAISVLGALEGWEIRERRRARANLPKRQD